MISVCPVCSGVDIDKLKLEFGAENVQVGCIGECGGRDGLLIGYANGKYIEAETEEEFVSQIEK